MNQVWGGEAVVDVRVMSPPPQTVVHSAQRGWMRFRFKMRVRASSCPETLVECPRNTAGHAVIRLVTALSHTRLAQDRTRRDLFSTTMLPGMPRLGRVRTHSNPANYTFAFNPSSICKCHSQHHAVTHAPGDHHQAFARTMELAQAFIARTPAQIHPVLPDGVTRH